MDIPEIMEFQENGILEILKFHYGTYILLQISLATYEPNYLPTYLHTYMHTYTFLLTYEM